MNANVNPNTLALQRSLPDVVAEYDLKLAAIPDADHGARSRPARRLDPAAAPFLGVPRQGLERPPGRVVLRERDQHQHDGVEDQKAVVIRCAPPQRWYRRFVQRAACVRGMVRGLGVMSPT